MKKRILLVCLAVMSMVLLTSCEKVLLDEQESQPEGNVVLKLSAYEQVAFGTRSMQDIRQLCTRVNVAFFQNGTKVKTVSQKAEDSSFGTVSLTLDEGVYQVVVIAHNCSGSATISSAEKVTFPSNVVSDTFYYEGNLTVEASQNTHELLLQRPVAMFRLQLTDDMPSNAQKIRFYYTGGSSTFNPSTGFGCVNSRQTVMMNIEAGQKVFEVYTFPHELNDFLKLTVTIYDSSENILMERLFEQVPVTVDQITVYTGSFFGGGGGDNGGNEDNNGENTYTPGGITMKAESEWSGVSNYSF